MKSKSNGSTGYSAENVALFNAALAKAEAVMANEELSVYEQPIVDAAVLDLQNAMKALNDEKDNASKPSDPSKPSNPSKPGSGNGDGATGSTRIMDQVLMANIRRQQQVSRMAETQ